jgi:polar amino acid transport system substrate-binding protein
MTMFPTAEDPRRGVVIDMVNDIYQQAGYQVELIEVPYARGMEMVSDGQCDMLPEKEYSPLVERGFVYANVPTFRYPTAFVVRHGDRWRFDGVASLGKRRVATGIGWTYSSINPDYQAYLDDPQNAENVELMTGENDVVPRILKMIAGGRVDAYADNVLVLEYIRAEMGLENQLDIVTPDLGGLLVEMPIFSSQIPQAERDRLIAIWDQGRKAINGDTQGAYLARYGVSQSLINR